MHFCLGHEILDMIPKSKTHLKKLKFRKQTLPKLKYFAVKVVVMEMKRQTRDREKIFGNHL